MDQIFLSDVQSIYAREIWTENTLVSFNIVLISNSGFFPSLRQVSFSSHTTFTKFLSSTCYGLVTLIRTWNYNVFYCERIKCNIWSIMSPDSQLFDISDAPGWLYEVWTLPDWSDSWIFICHRRVTDQLRLSDPRSLVRRYSSVNGG